ncbi:MAG: glycoside hydrolase family 16 protein [Bacteroidales bacterium]|nr:glycoside hydrolase family 16 protein [Bacteroidales bacterium]
MQKYIHIIHCKKMLQFTTLMCFLFITTILYSQDVDPHKPLPGIPADIPGYQLVWHDEFDMDGKPDSTNWEYETGFVRNHELQWYQKDNAFCKGGILIIEGRREKIKNPDYKPDSRDWRKNRAFAEYTSSSLTTRSLHQWQYGRIEVKAMIDTSLGSWPAIWTLGVNGEWPICGEADIMEFYRINDIPHILANVAWGTEMRRTAKWDSEKIPFSHFTSKDAEWHRKYHIWAMEWDTGAISLFLDGELLNTTLLTETLNPEGSNPFRQPHYLLLNLAIGANGGNPEYSILPITYKIDYVRVYRKID